MFRSLRVSGPEQPGARVSGLLDFRFGLGWIALGLRLGDAVRDVAFQEVERHGLQALGGGRDLGQDVDAVLVVLDHPLEPSDLALDALQAALERGLVAVVPVFVAVARFAARLPDRHGVSLHARSLYPRGV